MTPEAQFCKGPMVKFAALNQLLSSTTGVQHSDMYCATPGFAAWKSVMADRPVKVFSIAMPTKKKSTHKSAGVSDGLNCAHCFSYHATVLMYLFALLITVCGYEGTSVL